MDRLTARPASSLRWRSVACALLAAICFQAASTPAAVSGEPDPGRFIAVYPDRHDLKRLPDAWPGLYQMIRAMHAELGTPLVSNGLFYVGPLFDAIDKQATRQNTAGVIGEIRNLATLGPDGGFTYTWVYWVPGVHELPSTNVQVCYEAVGRPRGAGFITPGGEFIRIELPESIATCTGLIAAAHPEAVTQR